MKTGSIHIGTSGWSYKDWVDIFYPPNLKSTEWLGFYAKEFKTTEINSSFYHLPKPQTVLNWVKQVPEDFLFCPKVSRYLTHIKRLHDPEEPLQRFFDVFDLIKDHLGPVLVQLPPSLKFNPDVITPFFELLRSKYKDYDFVLEFRHESWMVPEATKLMADYKIGLVISQSGVGFPYSEEITSHILYIRFHGPGNLYASSYEDKTMKEFASKFKKWKKEGHDIWAFFNNDYKGYGLDNARTLEKFIKART